MADLALSSGASATTTATPTTVFPTTTKPKQQLRDAPPQSDSPDSCGESEWATHFPRPPHPASPPSTRTFNSDGTSGVATRSATNSGSRTGSGSGSGSGSGGDGSGSGSGSGGDGSGGDGSGGDGSGGDSPREDEEQAGPSATGATVAAGSQPSIPHPGSNLFVSGLAPTVDDAALMKAFEPFGSVISAKVMLRVATGVSRGFGFVLFEKAAQAQKAITSMQGATIGGHQGQLQVSVSEHRGENVTAESRVVYLRNVPFGAVEAHRLGEYLDRFGRVERSVARSVAGGKLVNFIVTFANVDSARACVTGTHGKHPFPECTMPILAKTEEPQSLREERLRALEKQRQPRGSDTAPTPPASLASTLPTVSVVTGRGPARTTFRKDRAMLPTTTAAATAPSRPASTDVSTAAQALGTAPPLLGGWGPAASMPLVPPFGAGFPPSASGLMMPPFASGTPPAMTGMYPSSPPPPPPLHHGITHPIPSHHAMMAAFGMPPPMPHQASGYMWPGGFAMPPFAGMMPPLHASGMMPPMPFGYPPLSHAPPANGSGGCGGSR